jgi:hypothetical protein
MAKLYSDEDEYVSTSIASSKKSEKSKEVKSPNFGRYSKMHLATSRAQLSAMDDPKSFKRPESFLTYQETLYRKRYDAKTEELKKSAANAERAIRAKQLYLQNKYPLNYKKKKIGSDDYEDTEDLSQEVSKFVSLVKRLTIKDGQTPLPEKLRESPKYPRLFSNLSIEGQYALLKTYEDTIANLISESYPNLEPYIPRVMTAKFRKRPLAPKVSILHRLNPRRESTTSSKLKPRLSVFKTPSLNSSHNILEHKLKVSTELEIAQEILDLVRLQKGEYVTGEKVNQKMDVLRTYAAFAKLWAKHFNLR